MVASELRASARESLKGKWGKAALLVLCYGVIMFAINFILNLIPLIGQLASLVISVPISFGMIATFIKLKRDEEVGYSDFLSIGFANFSKAWGVWGNIILKMILPIVLVIISIFIMAFGMTGSIIGGYASSYHMFSGFGALGIIGFLAYIASIIYAIVKGYLYLMSYYILYDHPEMTGKEIVEESESLMKGNRWSFFWLILTFIGWSILVGFTFGIGMLWLTPYIAVSSVCFYEGLSNVNSSKKTEVTPADDNPIQE